MMPIKSYLQMLDWMKVLAEYEQSSLFGSEFIDNRFK